jgi:uncharacterized membrane protein YdjX (TVP38/TMEM64 family)
MHFAVFILALLVRIAAIELSGAEAIRSGEAADYLAAAALVCEQGVYPERGNLPFFRAPGLPFFVAGVTLCQPARTRAIKYALAACDAATVLLIVLIARLLWGAAIRERRYSAIPFFAAVLAIPHPLQVAALTDIHIEPLFTMLIAASIWLLLRGNPAVAGAAVALASLTRPMALLCIPLFALFLALRPEGKEQGVTAGGESPSAGLPLRSRQGGFRPVLLFVFTAGLMLAPWTLRNAIRFGELIVVNDAAGFSLWQGTHPELLTIVKTEDPVAFQKRAVEFERVAVPAAAAIVEARASTPGARDAVWRRLALENVRTDPLFALSATLEKAALYWRPWLHPAQHSTAAVVLSLMVSLTLFLGGVSGMTQFPHKRLLAAALLFLAAFWLAHVPFIPTIRLRMPFTDPLLICFTAGALSAATTRLRSDWKTFAPLIAVVAIVIAAALMAGRMAYLPAAESAVVAIRSAAAEWWAVPLFVLLYAVFALLLLPVGLLSATAAVAWGWKVGGAIELVTCTIAAVAPYLVARRGLSGWLARRIRHDDAPALTSPFTLFILRLVPVIPYVALNYIAGAVRVRPRDFILTTLTGSIPSVFLFAYFVDTMAQGAVGTATQAKILAVCVLVATVAVVLRVVARKVRLPRTE